MTPPDLIERARKAGSKTSERKAEAARRNGLLGGPHGIKGGRPANPEIKRIMQERGVSRQRAHQILRSLASA
ncbi:MAG TPA: hypothetical protein VJN64_07475 [Terriglobales bacterium]|nr:hypothetical protein [Terriglobales bacterium]